MAYFSTGSEGMKLDVQCSWCPIPDDTPCPILLAQTHYNYDQNGNRDLARCLNILVNKKGECMMKPILEKAAKIKPGVR